MATFEFVEPPLLSQAGFDRADHLRDDAGALSAGWPSARVLLLDHQGRYPIDGDGALAWLSAAEVAAEPPADAVLLGVLGQTQLWARRSDQLPEPVSDPRLGAHLLSADEAGLLATALGMLNWHRSAQYSPLDGARTEAARAGWVRRSPGGADEFPRTDPAVIMVVHDGGDRILLGRQHAWPYPWFSTLAGFVEPGESVEQCVVREVAEEVGVVAHFPHYLGSQPWPFPRSLMLGFEVIADPQQPLALLDGELAQAQWFTRDQVRHALERQSGWGGDAEGVELMLPPAVSIARSLITSWTVAKKKHLEWPVWPIR
ncbi:NADH pyrophosphatase [Gordonia hirsuta DSM 44140 = NBRC 16056]|uniref:NAD(+) diphosphatase n=1 Tax=Gordonia hirsuta DSM 44140 = NBRC 16056 TaxID=1121927 RepID=L7L8J4_9ACTN|nr:NAD(+) diphosphatase [Gordonia hirsuta]GAC56377.1 NADH pyrophosphatase [Gordonia hirsuta DSM 44140 = NBRC 16056]